MNIYRNVKNFMVLPQTEMSDHSKIVTEFYGSDMSDKNVTDEYKWKNLKPVFKWDNNKIMQFSIFLQNSNDLINVIQQRLEAGLIDSSGEKIQQLFLKAAKHTFEEKKSLVVKNKGMKKCYKKWFDSDCNKLKHEVRKSGRYKHAKPLDTLVRQKYHEKLREYKSCSRYKRKLFRQKNLNQVENSLNDSKKCWDSWKKCSETYAQRSEPDVDGETWFNHFSNLHAETRDINNNVNRNEFNTLCEVLNDPFTIKEIENCIISLGNAKAVGYDRVSNEMIKNAPGGIRKLLLDYINLWLEKSLSAKSFCTELIIPIFKAGSKADPNDYRGICISSAITKLFTSMINTRIQKVADEKGLISKNQIGFKKNSRTSDHLLTLKMIIKKYVQMGKKKIYACFVDLKKAYDSVPHKGLFLKLRKIGLNGKLLDLIEDIYRKTTCAVKVDNRVTIFFNYDKGVRQGCPMSPLLFNIYINDIVEKIIKVSKSPIFIEENQNVDIMLYADDLIILAKSEEELQEKMNVLQLFCQENKLQVNEKKTKVMVFNRGNNLCKAKIYVNNALLENVKEIKYLGFTIGAKNCNFKSTIIDLATKAKRVIFALNSKMKLGFIPIRLSLKIFSSQILPILLYGAEVWAPYSNYNFKNWERSETEKCHTQFLKRIIGCDIRTSNVMVRTELGRRPLLCDIVGRSVNFINHLKLNENSLANQSLNFDKELNDEINIFQLIRNFIPNLDQDVITNKIKIKKWCQESFDKISKDELNKLSKSESYRLYKVNTHLEKYLYVIKNNKSRRALARFRLSCHPLMIEKGRHRNPPLERTERICPFCKNCTEDEIHFLTKCPLYEVDRAILYEECLKSTRNFQLLTEKERFIFIMSNENHQILEKLGQYIVKSLKSRELFMSENMDG